MLIVIKYLVLIKSRKNTSVAKMSIFAFYVQEQNTSRRTVNGFRKCLFNGSVYVEFRVCFPMEKYENDMFLLCETSNAFIGAFCYSKIHFHPSGPFKSIKTMLKFFTCFVNFISSMESLSKGW